MEQAIYQAVVSTFEELGFMFPVSEEEGFPAPEVKENIGVSVNFNGYVTGRVVLKMAEPVARELAENMLCEDIDEEMVVDVAGEAGNVVCGNILPLIYGDTEVFQLDAPEFVNSDGFPEPKERIQVQFESGNLEVCFFENATS